MNNRAFIALGSNIKSRSNYLKQAVQLLNSHEGILLENLSSVYETDPVGYTNQSAFLNMVAEIKTELPPLGLLDVLQEIELHQNRKREVVWGPRTLDLDILLYNEEVIHSSRLIVPHPRMTERAFVMVPLSEIASDFIIPAVDIPTLYLAERLAAEQGIKLIGDLHDVTIP
ncbi:2-amino-4-hydroxy-6-hydroxymethyldihydropteridine diphosphokinase [Priestia flexa]|uniref:2-amino-4-hydroxy-6- hydroxymethyldihydropteridine diphosphokinase n=1 Tax=Priestia flexa TaxID=86664 RepID=UPI001B325D2D|nr:2-amino-4-hydroxy-6-hydroxymethyldihydropteridine diphosphokinase [Priestia flexa]